MNKNQKINHLYNPSKNILLSDFLAPLSVRVELMNYFKTETEAGLLDKLNVDFYYLSFRDLSQNETLKSLYKGPSLWYDEKHRKCPFGITWKRAVYDDKFGVDEAVNGPFRGFETTENDILNYNWPDPEEYDYTQLVSECEMYRDKILVGGLWSGIHGDSNRMMGYENFLFNIAMNKPLVKVLVDRITEFYLKANRKYFEAVKGKMDIFFMGNDFGTQNGLLISLEDWFDIYYENYKKLIDLAHSYGFKVMVHSCGGIYDLLPYFIKLGIDILDPVQTTAKGMNPDVLIENYGKDLVFHGAIDTQHMLMDHSSDEVYEYCLEMIRIFNKFGMFVIAPSNNFMPGTPVENILSVYKAADESKGW